MISTKYGSPYKIHESEKYGCQSNWGGAGTKSMKKSLEESLKKLQTSYVDILYLHWWDYATSIPELSKSLQIPSHEVLLLGVILGCVSAKSVN